jgi:hypothetical protein
MAAERRPVEKFISKTIRFNKIYVESDDDDEDFDAVLVKSLFATPTPPDQDRQDLSPRIIHAVEDAIGAISEEVTACVTLPVPHDISTLDAIEAKIERILHRLNEARVLVRGFLSSTKRAT